MRRALHIVLAVLAVAACQGPRIIPKGTLTDIYTDMFLADQMVRAENLQRPQMDSLLLYEAVFEKYGYDTDDYLHTVRYYLRDPERFSKVFEAVTKRLEGEVEALNKLIDEQSRISSYQAVTSPLLDSLLAPFSKETIYVGLPRVVRDTSQYSTLFRLVPVREDTLMISVDSLAARALRDSLKAAEAADTTARAEKEKTLLERLPKVSPKERERIRASKLPPQKDLIVTEEIPVEEVVLE